MRLDKGLTSLYPPTKFDEGERGERSLLIAHSPSSPLTHQEDFVESRLSGGLSDPSGRQEKGRFRGCIPSDLFGNVEGVRGGSSVDPDVRDDARVSMEGTGPTFHPRVIRFGHYPPPPGRLRKGGVVAESDYDINSPTCRSSTSSRSG